MAGEAKSSDFLLSTATVMIGPSSKVMELTPALHSVGLVKNVQASSEPQYTELTQGVEALVVASVQTGSQSKISAEVYEYTARNLAYACGVDATGTNFDPSTDSMTLATALTGASASATIALGTGGGAKFSPGDWGVIQDTSVGDRLHVFRVGSISTDTLTLAAGYSVPVGQAYTPQTTTIYKVRALDVGPKTAQPTFGCKMVGILPNSGEPVTLIFPKVKVTKGLSLAFQTDNWQNLPFEMTPYALLPTDPFYADFGKAQFKVMRR